MEFEHVCQVMHAHKNTQRHTQSKAHNHATQIQHKHSLISPQTSRSCSLKENQGPSFTYTRTYFTFDSYWYLFPLNLRQVNWLNLNHLRFFSLLVSTDSHTYQKWLITLSPSQMVHLHQHPLLAHWEIPLWINEHAALYKYVNIIWLLGLPWELMFIKLLNQKKKRNLT